MLHCRHACKQQKRVKIILPLTSFFSIVMKLIIGLGNPGTEYDGTRHNIGFAVADALAAHHNASFSKEKGRYLSAKIKLGSESVGIIKPMTYMNHSGHAVVAAMNFYKVARTEIVVICDDLNLPVGTMRLRPKGSAGGQNGLKHIIECFGSNEFARLRIGIGSQNMPKGGFSSFVLGKFSEQEKSEIAIMTVSARDCAIDFALHGLGHAMNHFNTSKL